MMKRKHFLWLLGLLGFYLCTLLLYRPAPYAGHGQGNPLAHYQFSSQLFNEAEVKAALPKLKALYGTNKVVPPEYERHFYTALSFYPQLELAAITFTSKPLPTSMRAKPSNGSLLTRKRQYCIFINDQSADVVDLSQANFTELTGCIIHELAHIEDYEDMTNGGIIWTGIRYLLSQQFKSRLEKNTDRIAAEHGGGYYLFQFTDFIFNRAEAAKGYLKNKQENYYSPSDLWELHQEYKTWSVNAKHGN